MRLLLIVYSMFKVQRRGSFPAAFFVFRAFFTAHCETVRSIYSGILMLILLNVALQPSAKTPMCAPSMECVMQELSA